MSDRVISGGVVIGMGDDGFCTGPDGELRIGRIEAGYKR